MGIRLANGHVGSGYETCTINAGDMILKRQKPT